jgi:Tol biopolymer transport system component
MQRLDDELRDLAAHLASSVDTSKTYEEVERRTLRRRRARPRKTWILVASGLIGIAAFVPVFLALRGRHQVPTASTSPSSAPFQLEGRLTVWAVPAGQDQSHLYTITKGGVPERLGVDVRGPQPSLEASWSPDGTRFIVWESDTGTRLEPPPGRLVIVSTTTGQETTLIRSKFIDNYVAWSPLGDEIAFATAYGDIYLIHPDGSGLKQLTRSGGPCSDDGISWSPDGSRIAFSRNCDGQGDRGIYVMNADGSDPHMIVRPANNPVQGGGRDVLQTSWSPDGSTLVYMQWPGNSGHGSVYLIDLDGSNPRLLADTSNSPTWSPDGSMIAVVDELGVLRVLGLDGKTTTTLDNLSGFTVIGVVSWTGVPS